MYNSHVISLAIVVAIQPLPDTPPNPTFNLLLSMTDIRVAAFRKFSMIKQNSICALILNYLGKHKSREIR
jgi:hypothetical protein